MKDIYDSNKDMFTTQMTWLRQGKEEPSLLEESGYLGFKFRTTPGKENTRKRQLFYYILLVTTQRILV
jgi:hypothetical protein